jgi:hypothetical protein
MNKTPENLSLHRHTLRRFKTRGFGSMLYIIAMLLIIAWAIGFIGYSAGGLIHLLLLIAVIAILIRIMRRRKALKLKTKIDPIL